MQISIGSRGGEVHRIVARDRYVNGINGEFLDVRARFAHQFINHEERLRTPLIRYKKGGKLIPATWDQALEYAVRLIREASGNFAVASNARITNEAMFALRKFSESVEKALPAAVSDRGSMREFLANLSAPLATHEEIRHAGAIILIGGEPEEEQTFTAKQIRQAVRNDGAKCLIVNERLINLRKSSTSFLHIVPGSYEAFALALFGDLDTGSAAEKIGVERKALENALSEINSANGDLVIMAGNELDPKLLAYIAAAAHTLSTENRRVLLHPLLLYNNSLGAIDIYEQPIQAEEVIANAAGAYIAGSLDNPEVLKGKQFVIVQELFETETTEFADVVLPAASFAEVDGTFTNNAGQVQRVRKAIEPLHLSKPDWLITILLAKSLGVELGLESSASGIFRQLSQQISAYSGLRYPMMKDESKPARAQHYFEQRDRSALAAALQQQVGQLTQKEKNNEPVKVGHKLHRLTTMTSKTPQFHLLAHGNPKPENLLVSPLEQFNPDGTPRPTVLSVGAGDRE
jgi:NADH-quinone oxidoreductase subunit G